MIKSEQVEKEMRRIIKTYIKDDKLCSDYFIWAQEDCYKGLIYAVDKHKIKEFTDSDKEILKDIWFYRC